MLNHQPDRNRAMKNMMSALFVVAVSAALSLSSSLSAFAETAASDSSVNPSGKSPIKVFILAGQSNMEGQAVVDGEGPDYNDGKGTLAMLMRDPVKAPLFKQLKNADGKWAVRDDVWVRYQREDAALLAGPLALGYSVYGDEHHFGAELPFGHVVGDHLTNQVLIIKTAWGGKSLNVDFRSPSSGGNVGPYYTKMVHDIREGLANIKKDFPAYDEGGYELAGFVWWHGWNDFCDAKAVPEYEQNLVNLINDVRKELNTPNLPVIIGEFTGPWETNSKDLPKEALAIRQAQAAVAAKPEFKKSLRYVKTADFVRKAEDSPNVSHGHHEFGNAETYFLVGDALGKAMIELLKK